MVNRFENYTENMIVTKRMGTAFDEARSPESFSLVVQSVNRKARGV